MPIRFPSPRDHDALLEILSQAGSFRPEEVLCARELLEAALANEPGNSYELLIAAAADDRPVGYACYGRTPMTETSFDLYWLLTAARMRGQGIGRDLMTGLESQIRASGGARVRIETSSLEGQGGAERFYRRCGYEQVGLIEDFYRPGDHLVTFAKRL